MKFSMKRHDGEATIIHHSGNEARTDNADIVRLLQNAIERDGLDTDDQQCLMSVLYDAMGGLRPVTVHAA